MVGGGLIQIVAQGTQDLFLTNKPEITYFKSVYRRHTNFALETSEEVFTNSVGFGRTVHCVLPRKADLISHLTVNIKLGSLNCELFNKLVKYTNIPHKEKKNIINQDGNIIENKCSCYTCMKDSNNVYGWVNAIGNVLLKSMWIDIGGKRIDKQYGEWLSIWAELTSAGEKIKTYLQMIGAVKPKNFTAETFSGELDLYVPLNFWFCRSYGLALPILSLYYHQVELGIEFRDFNELWVSTKKTNTVPFEPSFEATLLVEYIYLDTNERSTFYKQSHTYLIDQLQYSECPVKSMSTHIDFNFNHPIKELIWILQRTDAVIAPNGTFPCSTYPIGNDWTNFTPYLNRAKAQNSETFKSAVIKFNDTDRFNQRNASYFRLYQNFYYHTRGPSNNIYTYSFGLWPEANYPTGQMNFSRIKDAKLIIDSLNLRNTYTIHYYATNFNILIITGGLGAVMFTD